MRIGTRNVWVVCSAAAFMAGGAFGQLLDDDFESYDCGEGIGGNGIWSYWDGDPTWDSFVSCDQAHAGTKSLDIVGDSDTVAIFDADECGAGVLTAWQYVPGNMSGLSYFIFQDIYNHGGPYDWAIQVNMDTSTGVISDDVSGNTLPLITDQWVEIRVEIDIDNDTQTFFYGGDELYSGVWNGYVSGAGGGADDLGALDLFANGATSVYYDDVSVTGFSTNCGPCQTFEIDNLVGGQTATFTVSSPDNPNANFGVIYFLNETAAQDFADCLRDAPSNNLGEVGQCYGGDPRDTLACQGRLNGSGDGSCNVRVPGAGSGRTVSFVSVIQTADGFCPSEVVTQTIL